MAYWPGCLLVTAGFLCLLSLTGLAYCGLLAWLFAAYWSGLLWLLGLVVCCFLIRLLGHIAAYWPGLLWLTGLINCSLLIRLIELAYCGLLA